ncbi:galactose-3-O-sulfotransferase 2-like [Branchiostoma lanceolatum]|uniref:galactose-3-O-sulfotransferase 2-like n=1 Tax=Branchiostoma lanceolatum TaxID=7740 RepID=UPI003455BB33
MFIARQTVYAMSLVMAVLFIHVVITPQLAEVVKRSLTVVMTTPPPTATTPKPTHLGKPSGLGVLSSGVHKVKERNLSLRKERKLNVPSSPQTCTPHTNLAFIKVHKCGSSTTQAIFMRYGFEHDLVVALPRDAISPWIGCGSVMRPQHVMELPPGTKWSIFTHHTIYNKINFERFMPKDTRFVAILRDPLSRIKSAFNYFHLEENLPGIVARGRSLELPIQTYLKNPAYWDGVFVEPKKCYHDVCVKNCMAKDLGLQQRIGNSQRAVEKFIQGIERDFTLFMIMEYFDHSLVMLKRHLCWTLSDILYNSRQYKAKNYKYKSPNTTIVTKKMEDNYKLSSVVDHALYAYFNQSLWRKIREEGEDFLEEVRHFQAVLGSVWRYCAVKNQTSRLRIKSSSWNDEFVVDRKFCSNLRKQRWQWDLAIRDKLFQRFYEKAPKKN